MNDLRIAFENNRVETGKMLSLIGGYNRMSLSEEEKNRLNEWITGNDYNQRLFEMLTDKSYAPVLRDIVKSLCPGTNSL